MSVEWILFKTTKKYSLELSLKKNSHQTQFTTHDEYCCSGQV